MIINRIIIAISFCVTSALFGMEEHKADSTAKLETANVSVSNETVNSFDNPNNPFYQANQLFKQSQYAQATLAYNDIFRAILAKRIIVTDDDVANALACYGQACWALGFYKKGSLDFEARLGHSSKPKLKKPLPYGITARELKNKTLLVRANEPGTGLGDTFSFLGMLQEFKKVGVKVILVTRTSLKSVISRSAQCADAVLSEDEAQELEKENLLQFDYDFYVISVMAYVSTKGITPVEKSDDIPNYLAYIHPLEELVQKYLNLLSSDEKFKNKQPLGIWWAASSNPVPGGRVLQRDVPLKIMALLANIKRPVALISLQGDKRYPITQEELQDLSQDQQVKRKSDSVSSQVKELIYCADKEITDFDKIPFEDTLALMAAINLRGGYLVGPDTSIPNLAGAAGFRTCLLLGKDADTRWGESDPGAKAKLCHLYNTVYEFWQDKNGNWEPVIRNVIEYINND